MFIGTLISILAISINTYTYQNKINEGIDTINATVSTELISDQEEVDVLMNISFEYSYSIYDAQLKFITDIKSYSSYTLNLDLTSNGNTRNNNMLDLLYVDVSFTIDGFYTDYSEAELEATINIEAEFENSGGVVTDWVYSNSHLFYVEKQNMGTIASLQITPTNIIYNDPQVTYEYDDVIEQLKLENALEYSRGFTDGFETGDRLGYERGFNQGYDDGLQTGREEKYEIIELIKRAFNIVVMLLQIEIFPGIYMAAAFGIPLILAIVFFVLRWFR